MKYSLEHFIKVEQVYIIFINVMFMKLIKLHKLSLNINLLIFDEKWHLTIF
jgi:hypothetical protein